MHTLTKIAVLAIMASFAGGCAAHTARIKEARVVRQAQENTDGPSIDDRIVDLMNKIDASTDPEEEEVLRGALKIELKAKQAELENEKKKSDTLAMKEAREKLEDKKESTEKLEKRVSKANNFVDLRGCEPSDTFWVNPSVGNDWGLRETAINSMVLMTIVNRGREPVEIVSSLHKTLVKGLCPGGTITLVFSGRSRDPLNMNFVVTATARPEPTIVQTDSRYLSIPGGDYNSRQIMSQLWEVSLH